ncbi:isopenicillin N synthase family oxygenase [Antrihabitans sp. YC2-6]|uniref:isopenicillin N synthase family dioxygenase n=1 Tax=Antrihabitans sp. YC2-6 TaxID=2799498 RepID=UPI0018F77629|nr:isopenicillin N synthase family oxygenase [Antrihabitans sp. YC2-6]MBJ8348466.1 isopenicillin N synthase family oxygenase [Antrihabitans sp. YC2-6]
MTQLPVIDLRTLDSESTRTDLRDAAHEVGFFYLTGHGVGEDESTDVLKLARRFFELPQDAKDRIAMRHSPHFRGYTRLGRELTGGQIDWREQIDIGPDRPAMPAAQGYWNLQGPNQWPVELPEFRPAIEEWNSRLAAIGLRLLRAWATALGAPASTFDAAFATAPATLTKVVRYPGSNSREQGVGAHKDAGVLTLLLVEPDSTGLQVEAQGQWIDAPALPGTFIVNTGELLEVATGGYLKATRHRVSSPPRGAQRLSIPFFFNPALDARIPEMDLPKALRRRATGITDDPDNPIFSTYGENAWKSRLRAHPDVALAQHGITGPAGAPSSPNPP